MCRPRQLRCRIYTQTRMLTPRTASLQRRALPLWSSVSRGTSETSFKAAEALSVLTDGRGERRGLGELYDPRLRRTVHKHHGKGNCLFSTLLLFQPTRCHPSLVAFNFKLMNLKTGLRPFRGGRLACGHKPVVLNVLSFSKDSAQ